MPNAWTEYKGFRYCVSPQAHSSGQQREWVYDVAGASAGKERILYHGQARSAARAEASARKWIASRAPDLNRPHEATQALLNVSLLDGESAEQVACRDRFTRGAVRRARGW
jgi:hypothetical protein